MLTCQAAVQSAPRAQSPATECAPARARTRAFRVHRTVRIPQIAPKKHREHHWTAHARRAICCPWPIRSPQEPPEASIIGAPFLLFQGCPYLPKRHKKTLFFSELDLEPLPEIAVLLMLMMRAGTPQNKVATAGQRFALVEWSRLYAPIRPAPERPWDQTRVR